MIKNHNEQNQSSQREHKKKERLKKQLQENIKRRKEMAQKQNSIDNENSEKKK